MITLNKVIRRILHLPPPVPPKPTRIAKCFYCKEDIKTEIMEGEVAHIFCQLNQDAINKVKKDKEDADRHQIELYKIAIREAEQEKLAKQFDTKD